MRTIASLRPFPMSAGNFVGNTIEKVAVLPISIPPRKKYLVYSLFTWGEGGPAKPGRMRGRFGTQPFLVEVENGGCRLSPQRNFSSAPLGNPVAPSSVTFGDSFPPRGSLRRCYTPATQFILARPLLPQNANPNQGTYMGTVIVPRPEQCGTIAKTSECQRAGPKKGGAGALPRDSLRPGFL